MDTLRLLLQWPNSELRRKRRIAWHTKWSLDLEDTHAWCGYECLMTARQGSLILIYPILLSCRRRPCKLQMWSFTTIMTMVR